MRRGMRPIVASWAGAAAGLAILGLTAWIIALPGTLQAAQSSAERIQYPSGGAMIDAYIGRPKGAQKSPAVIVVHDNLGANATFQQMTRDLAGAGFVALAPHLPSRKGTPAMEPSPTEAPRAALQRAVTGLDSYQTVEDVKAAFAFLQKDPGVDAARISAVGIGWGAFRVWKLAEEVPTLHRAVVYYGNIPTNDAQLPTIRVGVLGHYAEQDYLSTSRVIKTKKLLGEKFTYHIYPTVPGFAGGGTGEPMGTDLDGSTPQAVAAAAKQAWTRTVAFLKN